MIITKILMTLPVNYNHFVSKWESAPAGKRALVNFIPRLTIQKSRHSIREEKNGSALSSKVQHVKTRHDKNSKGKSKEAGMLRMR